MTAAAADLPHAYPFRFVDRVESPAGTDFSDGRVSIRVTAGGRAAMGAAWQQPALFVEALAQAALLLEGGDADIGRSGFLAGVEDFEIRRAPEPGDTLSVRVRLAARFGAMVKFEGEVLSGSEVVGRGSILVRRGREGAPAG